jgi:hypothetical protein
MRYLKSKAIILTLALCAATLITSCKQPRRIFHGNFEVATPMSDEI